MIVISCSFAVSASLRSRSVPSPPASLKLDERTSMFFAPIDAASSTTASTFRAGIVTTTRSTCLLMSDSVLNVGKPRTLSSFGFTISSSPR